MIQMLCRFASREAFLAACPVAWDVGMPDPEMPPQDGALVVLGVLLDPGVTPEAPPVPRPGYHVLALFLGEPLPAFGAAQIQWQPGDPVIPSEVLPTPPAAPDAVPAEITRAQARVVMAAHILPDGRSLLRAMRELLAAQQDATAELPDADPRKIAAAQASEWWTAAATYHRTHPVLLQAAATLGITASEIDELFRMAARVTG